MADIQEDIACNGVCVNEKHNRDRERCPARPYSSSSAGTSGVVLRHRAAAAACACLTTAAATFCTPEAAAQIRPADGFMHNQCPYSRVLQKVFFSNTVFYNCGLHRKLLSYHVHYHSFLQCRRRLRLETRKERIIFRRCPSLNSGALAVPGSRKILAPPLHSTNFDQLRHITICCSSSCCHHRHCSCCRCL